MQIGVVGPGRLGANISGRLMKAGHSAIVWDAGQASVAQAKDEKAEAFFGEVEDSGEGCWTIGAGMEKAVPADVLAASSIAWFRLRQQHICEEGPFRNAFRSRRTCRARQEMSPLL